MIRAAKRGGGGGGRGAMDYARSSGYGSANDSAYGAASAMSDSRVPCPHCGRRYNDTVAERHIPKCKDIIAKPRALPASFAGSASHHTLIRRVCGANCMLLTWLCYCECICYVLYCRIDQE